MARSLPPIGDPWRPSTWWPWQTTTVTLYFTDGRFLVPVSRRVPRGDDAPRAALEALLAGPSAASGLKNPIPAGVQLRSFALSGGVARADLSGPLSGDEATMRLAQNAIVETLTALPAVTAVSLDVDARPLMNWAGRTPLLYYPSANGLVAVPATVDEPRAAVVKYLSGPPDQAFTSFPADVKLLAYNHDGASGVLSLDFSYTPSVHALAMDQPERMRSLLLGLIASLTEFPDVRAVQVNFEGQTRLGLGQCSDLLNTPQRRPRMLNDERLLGR